jgi:hypothetical protein
MQPNNTKIKKTVRLDSSLVELIESYKSVNGGDFTRAVETLIARGYENTEKIEEIEKKLASRMKKIEQKQQQDTDRIVNLIVGISRMIGRVYGHTGLIINSSVGASKDIVVSSENNAIKFIMKDLKWREQELNHD